MNEIPIFVHGDGCGFPVHFEQKESSGGVVVVWVCPRCGEVPVCECLISNVEVES